MAQLPAVAMALEIITNAIECVDNAIFKPHKDATRKSSLSQEADFFSLLKARLLSLLGRFRKFWLVHLKIESFQALGTSDKL
jgi:hypothetical protein